MMHTRKPRSKAPPVKQIAEAGSARPTTKDRSWSHLHVLVSSHSSHAFARLVRKFFHHVLLRRRNFFRRLSPSAWRWHRRCRRRYRRRHLLGRHLSRRRDFTRGASVQGAGVAREPHRTRSRIPTCAKERRGARFAHVRRAYREGSSPHRGSFTANVAAVHHRRT